MATRSKPYTTGKLILDLVMLAFTCGMWIFVMIPWELYRFFGPKK